MRAGPAAAEDIRASRENTSSRSQIGVCIVKDQAILRAGLRMLIEDAGLKVVAEAANRLEAVTMAKETGVDVVLLDLDFVSDRGLDILSDLEAVCTQPIVVLTASSDPEVHQAAVQNGASGIVLKEEAPQILVNAIKQVDSGELWLRRSLLNELLMRQRSSGAPKKKVASEAQRISTLTPREREIVKLVAEGLNGKGIAGKLNVSEFTVRNHLTSILDKLCLANKFELAVYAFRNSLVAADH